MNCRRIEKLIPLYVEDDLGGEHASDVRAHLQRCAACRAQATEYEASQAWLRAAEAPDFDDTFVDTIRAGVMRELAAREAAPPFVDRLRQWILPRRLVVACAALLMIFAAVLLLVYASRSRLNWQEGLSAGEYKAPTVEQRIHDLKPAPRVESVAYRPRRRTVHRAAKPQDEIIAQPPLQAVTDTNKSAETLRIEIQTADPNIRIIWFAPKPTDADAPNPMGETR